MKKVWVNRFNRDGSMKPVDEWELWRCGKSQTHTYPCGGGRDFDRDGLPMRNCFIDEQGRVSDSGCYFYEHIGDQRGDGWLYVADGDLPPLYQEVITFDKNGHYEVSMLIATVCDTLEWYGCEPFCWQPITPPRFMNAL